MAEPYSSSSTWAGPVRSPSARLNNVAVRTLGCKVNRVESEQMATALLRQGVTISAEQDADIIIVNTCAVTSEAERKARKAARHAAALPRKPLVVVTGCAAVIAPERMSTLGERIIAEEDKDRIPGRVAQLLEIGSNPDAISREPHHLSPELPKRAVAETFRTRRMLKIEDGCDTFCAYCIVPYARGVPRSVPLDEVVATAREFVATGTPEIVLTGINVGRYRDGDAGLVEVIAAVAASGVKRLRLSSIEPLDVDARLLDELGAHDSVCRHLHVPLQSGSNRILDSMGRGYTIERFERVIAQAREALPGLVVTTDVMVGFPGETDEEAVATIEACERLGFAKLHVFRYSRREGTRAASMLGQVSPEIADGRARALREMGERLQHRSIERLLGTTADLLVERIGDGLFEGTTRHYQKVIVRSQVKDLLLGATVPVRLLDREGERVCAELV